MVDTLTLEGKLDLAAVGQLHDDLMARSGRNVIVNMSRVTHGGALCIQTLIAAAISARADGFSIKLTNTNDRVLGQLAAMGMTPETIMEGSA
tara:strand:+ start:393 stop:668 length:276 start_codon:yes stop_codon:yes gene_type:complete